MCSMFNISAAEIDCYGDICVAVIDPRLLSNCSLVGGTISLSVSALNQLGSGPPSDIYALSKLIVS